MYVYQTSVERPTTDVAGWIPLELAKLEPLDLPPEPLPDPEPPPLDPPPELATLPLAMSLWVQTPSARYVLVPGMWRETVRVGVAPPTPRLGYLYLSVE